MKSTVTENGFALISALVVLALVTAVSVSMALTQQHGIELTEGYVRNEQLRRHANAIQLWANGVLVRDMKENNLDSVLDNWNAPLQDIAIDNGNVDARIIDQQGKINLNNLMLAGSNGLVARNRFQRLLKLQEIEKDITDAIADWLDSDTEVRFPDGAEDDYYLSLEKPYRAANRSFAHPSELLLVKGVTREIYNKLAPYITTLPPGSFLNINTAPAKVLMTLSDSMDETGVDAIIAMRETTPFSVITSGSARGNNPNANRTQDRQSAEPGEIAATGNNPTQPVNTSSQLPEAANRTRQITDVEANRLYNEWTWSALRKGQNQGNTGAAANPQANTATASANANAAPATASGADSGIGAGGAPQLAFDAMPFVRDYQVDTTALGVTSNYFRVVSRIEQHGHQLDVEYVLQRDRTRDDVTLIYKSYNGGFYE